MVTQRRTRPALIAQRCSHSWRRNSCLFRQSVRGRRIGATRKLVCHSVLGLAWHAEVNFAWFALGQITQPFAANSLLETRELGMSPRYCATQSPFNRGDKAVSHGDTDCRKFHADPVGTLADMSAACIGATMLPEG
jgi:hypothetical protein